MYYFLHIDILMLLTLTVLSSCIEFYKLTFLYYLRLYLFHHLLIFIHWNFCITYSYFYFIMYCFVHIDSFILLAPNNYITMYWFLNFGLFILLTLILISSCIDFYKSLQSTFFIFTNNFFVITQLIQ